LLSGMCDATAHHFIFIMLLSHLVSRFIHVLLDCHLHTHFGYYHHTPSSFKISSLRHWHGTAFFHTTPSWHVINQTSRHLQEHCSWNAFPSPPTTTLTRCQPHFNVAYMVIAPRMREPRSDPEQQRLVVLIGRSVNCTLGVSTQSAS
jgi:hypothetical protein